MESHHGDDGVPADEAIPVLPELPETFKPFTDEQQKHIDEFTEAFNHYSRVLQYILTKYSAICSNHNNANGFEAWRRLHISYDQGEKAQHLAQLARIMKPTWNNTTQSPTDFIKTFQNWRDEIYEQSVANLPSAMKMTLLIQNIHGHIKSHLLLTTNLAKANFDDSATKVEDYYRNVYIDNNNGGSVQALQKPWKP
eukprot:2181921-Amphidinium_carterae.3